MTPEELDKARAEEARRIYMGEPKKHDDLAAIAARLAREGWTPPEPVDPDVLFVREVMIKRHAGDHSEVRAWQSGRWDETYTFRAALAVLRAERERVAALEPKADADGWIKHDGGPCRRARMWRCGCGLETAARRLTRGGNWDWRRLGRNYDIIAWRRA